MSNSNIFQYELGKTFGGLLVWGLFNSAKQITRIDILAKMAYGGLIYSLFKAYHAYKAYFHKKEPNEKQDKPGSLQVRNFATGLMVGLTYSSIFTGMGFIYALGQYFTKF